MVEIKSNEELVKCPECAFKFVKKKTVRYLCPMCEYFRFAKVKPDE